MASSSKPQLAVNAFQKDHNCAQSVLLAYARDFNIDEKTCLRLASGFGGGIGKTGSVCGAVTGAVMVLGLKGSGVGDSKELTYQRTEQFLRMFEDKFGSTDCGKLTEPKTAGDTKHFCDIFVQEATAMVEIIVNDKK